MLSFILRCTSLLIFGLAISMLFGCGRTSTLEMVGVGGSVTYQGKPIPEGEIRFMPQEGTKGPVSTAIIQDGRYEVKARGGVPAGAHRVEIRAFRTLTSKAAMDLPGAAPGGVKQQYLPKKFNDQSEMKETIDSGTRNVVKDFKLN
jgi:hypothetical protein